MIFDRCLKKIFILTSNKPLRLLNDRCVEFNPEFKNKHLGATRSRGAFPGVRGLVDGRKLVVAELPPEHIGVLHRMMDVCGAGNRYHVWISSQEPVQGDLT